MEHYVKVPGQPPDPPRRDGELRVTQHGVIRTLVAYGLRWLEESGGQALVVWGAGRQVGKAVSVAEIIKRKRPGLAQRTNIAYQTTSDLYVPKMEGLDPLKVDRHVPLVSIVLAPDQQAIDAAPDWLAPAACSLPPVPDKERRQPQGSGKRGRSGAKGQRERAAKGEEGTQ